MMWSSKVARFLVVLLVVLVNWAPITNSFLLSFTDTSNRTNSNALEAINSQDLYEESRKRKKKGRYFYGLILGAILVKMILFPLAVKAMAVMSSVSMILSTLSLVMSSIVGYAKLAYQKKIEPIVKLVHVNDVWAKGDDGPPAYIPHDSIEYGPKVPLEQTHFNT
ncbi:uncharacterized protein LOC126741924 [Anthonomus grandis grandis]|uniref:uncharacterized protein LOC126741924 n=1 Tax=Anthonomus grandis grandis TaxID=2921223 RepID=UPI002166B908|nr:uncharacterized protein LOC126741924 [Anthonomus grandis grandis]